MNFLTSSVLPTRKTKSRQSHRPEVQSKLSLLVVLAKIVESVSYINSKKKTEIYLCKAELPCNKICKVSFFFSWLSWHKLNLLARCSKADRDTHARTRTQIHKEDVPENCERGVFWNQTMCGVLAQMHLTSGWGTLNKQKNKSRQCACRAGWQRQRANIGIVFHLLPWLPKQGGYWQKEKEIKPGRQWVLGECLNVCTRSWWGWRERAKRRDSTEEGISIPLCVVGSGSSVTTPQQHNTDLQKPKQDPHSPKEKSDEAREL